MKSFFALYYIVFISVASIWSQTLNVEAVFNPKTYNNSYVSDSGHYIDSVTLNLINDICFQIDTGLNAQVTVVVLNSINGKDPLAFATDLGNLWRVGNDDRGVVLLASIEDRQMAIATGANIEPLLSDFKTKKIQENNIIPYFKNLNYGTGLYYGVKQIQSEIIRSKEESVQADSRRLTYEANIQEERNKHRQIRIFVLFVLGVLIGTAVGTILKIKAIQSMVISIFLGAVFTLFNTVLINIEDSKNEIFMSISYLVGYGLVPLFILNFYKIVKQNLVWISIPVGILYLASISILVSYYTIGTITYEDFYSVASIWYWLEHPVELGLSFILVFSLFFTYKVLNIYSNSDPYIRYQKLTKYKDYFLTFTPLLFPFPFLTLKMFKAKYETVFKFQPRYSRSTGLLMKLATETEENLYLSEREEAEEMAKSSDYHVWYSDQEGDVLVLQYKINSYNKGKCKSCGEKTVKQVSSKITKKATLQESGMLELDIACCHCDFKELVKRIIPQIVVHSSSPSMSRSRSGSSYRSSSSTSSSSSSSSSGGSWGGGSFGGGGSKSSW
jgi:uncharacterized protein